MHSLLPALPRESRDTLFLLLVIGGVIAPHAPHLPPWCWALVAGVLLWRSVQVLRGQGLPGRAWLVLLALLSVGATIWSFRTLHGRDAGVTLLAALLALKTLELRARRDAFVVFFLGFFVLLTQFLYSQTLPTAAGALLGLLGLLTALINSHLPLGRPSLRTSAMEALRLLLLGAPVMALLFVLFPRVAPLWGSPNDLASGRSGLSATMQVGTIAQLALDDSVVMRAQFEGTQPLPQDLYFRGPVLSSFDGREWTALRPTFSPRYQPPAQLEVSGAPLRYEVTLEPTRQPWLLLLDAAPEAPQSGSLPAGPAFMTRELQWRAQAALTDVLRYRAQSYPAFRHGPLRPMASLQDYQSLPAGSNPRTIELARQLRAAHPDAQPAELVQAVLTQLRSGGYRYTLEPGVYGEHTADEFWFDRKEGFCEHIASAYAVLMRALGIPTRIVTGYQGGEHNVLGGFWTVRQSDAHAWTEVWLEGQGWIRVDPTAAVAPGRIGALQRLSARPGLIANAISTVSPGLAINLRAVWEAFNHRWNQWVLNYTQTRQLDLLRSLGWNTPDWETLTALLLGSIALVIALGLGAAMWRQRRHDPWLRLLARAHQRLTRAGLKLPPHATPREMVRQLGHNRHPAVRDWLLQLEAQRYARADAATRRRELRRLHRTLRQLNWPISL